MTNTLDNGKYELRFSQNYQGIVDALVNAQERAGDPRERAYPANFAGIIAAIQDLDVNGSAVIGEKPPTWQPDGSDDGQYPGGNTPTEGELWFDTRQGRLFIYQDQNWYQTNGADGYCWVSPNAPSNPVTGQLWMDTNNNNQLYIYNANTYVDPTLRALGNRTFDGDVALFTETWVPIAGGDGTGQTTATLPLANPTTVTAGAKLIVNFPDTVNLSTQEHYNHWIMSAFNAVDSALRTVSNSNNVSSGENPPVDRDPDPNDDNDPGYTVTEGDLWFDTVRLDLNVFYDGYWVSAGAPNELTTSAASELDDKIYENRGRIDQAVSHLVSVETELNSKIDTLTDAKDANKTDIESIENQLNLVNAKIDARTTLNDVVAALEPVENRLTVLENATIDFSPYATKSDVTAQFYDYSTTEEINQLLAATEASILSAIPDITSKAEIQYVDDQINALDFLPSSGGTIDGFTVIRQNLSKAAFDFSTRSADGQDAFKFKAHLSPSTTTYSTSANPYEIAWQFDSNEDFAWKHQGDKVTSINKDGVYAKELYLAQFYPNDDNGLSTYNKISVRQLFKDLKSAVETSTDFDTLKFELLNVLQGV